MAVRLSAVYKIAEFPHKIVCIHTYHEGERFARNGNALNAIQIFNKVSTQIITFVKIYIVFTSVGRLFQFRIAPYDVGHVCARIWTCFSANTCHLEIVQYRSRLPRTPDTRVPIHTRENQETEKGEVGGE